MARQIIKQPNGKYCIFSTIVDSVTDYNMSVDDIIKEWSKVGYLTNQVQEIVDKLERGEKPYFQFTNSFEEMLEIVEEIHGKEESDEIRTLCRK